LGSERPRLDAVLLDAGGTIVRLDFEWMAETLGELGVASSPHALRRAEVEGRRRYDAFRAALGNETRATGIEHGRAYFGGMLDALEIEARRRDMALERYLARQQGPGLWVRPMEGAREMLQDLVRLGLRRAVVSNSDGRAEQHLRDCDFGDEFEFVIDSEIVGVEKPDPRIFRLALERMNIAAEHALYVGDMRAVDEAGARAAGMHAVVLDPFNDYVVNGSARIEGIGDLAGWIGQHFTVKQQLATPSKD